MADIEFVKRDQGGVNARIIARETKADFRRVEAASLKLRASFASAEGKRMFIRYFNTFQLSSHFIAVIARTRLDHGDVAKVEELIRAQMDKVAGELDRAIDGAEALFQTNAITSAATYDTVPLELEVGVLSSSSRRYLDLVTKLDQLMPLLQTLEIHEVITPQAVDIERAGFKRKVRDVANGARNLATRLRREMNAMDARRAEGAPIAGVEAGTPATAEATAEGGGATTEVLPAPDEVQAAAMAEDNAAAQVDGLVQSG
jgi:hypothetical protein